MSNWNGLAEQVLDGHDVAADEALAILQAGDDDLLPLLNAAFLLRARHHGRDVRIHVLRNAKGGLCPEDCAFYSQSTKSAGGAPRYRLQSVDELVKGIGISSLSPRYRPGFGASTRAMDRVWVEE